MSAAMVTAALLGMCFSPTRWLKDVRIHDLRHTFASNLVNAGHSLFVVSRALGHANIVQTARYSHLADDTLLAAADAAANAMGNTWDDLKKPSATT